MTSLVRCQEECPVCLELVNALEYHVFLRHLRLRPGSNRHNRHDHWECLCGFEEFAQTDQGFHLFRRHLEESGGLLVHLLASSLGVPPK